MSSSLSKIKAFFLAGASFSILFACATPENRPRASANDSSIRSGLEEFVRVTAPNRTPGSPGHERAFEWIRKRFAEGAGRVPGASVSVHRFFPDVGFAEKNYRKDFREKIAGKFKRSSAEFKKWNTFTGQAIAFVKRFEKTEGRNLILEVPGTRDPERVLYVGAHYDTITHDHDSMVFTPEGPAPGADDNASGLTALLWLADYFTAHPPGITLRFVAFDQEEIFFLGSYAFSRGLAEHKMPFQTRGRKTLGLVNLEMIGWSTKKGEAQAKIYTRPEGVKGVEADLALAAFFAEARVPSGPVVLKPGIVQNGFDRSDHWSFWQNGIPAICISEDWEGDFNDGNYHTRRDTPETLNYRYFEALLEWVKNGLLRLDAGWVTNSGP